MHRAQHVGVSFTSFAGSDRDEEGDHARHLDLTTLQPAHPARLEGSPAVRDTWT